MSFPTQLDFDAIANGALHLMNRALNNWRRAYPHSEEALMSQITSELAHNRRCNVGAHVPYVVRARVAELHRRGPRNIDHYGSDLAVTIIVGDYEYLDFGHFSG